MTLAAPLDAPIAPPDDQRRITEHDPRVVALRAVWRSRLARSIGQLTRDLRSLPPHATADATLTAFIHRHVGLLRAAYQDGHELGARDYYAGVSRHPQQWARTVATDERTERRRLAFYAPSVAKMAHEALLAWQQDQAARVHASETSEDEEPYRLAGGKKSPGWWIHQLRLKKDALSQWEDGLGARLTLQADVSWSGLQDGYVEAGAGDSIGLYSLLYWLLEPLAAHCDGCLEYAAGSPYNAPGLGGNTLDTAPGAGMTECGAACKCSLSYAAPGEIEQPFWNTMFAAKQQEWIASGHQQPPLPNVAGPARTDTAVVTSPLPRRAPPTIPLEPLEPLTLPLEGAALTDEQKSALDLYRATALAWEEWRGGLPPLPKMFADLGDDVTGTDPQVNAWLENMPDWTALSPKQQQLLGQVYEALADWALATSEAGPRDTLPLPPPDVTGDSTLFAEWMAGRRLLLGYNPYRDPHGRFAPGPHAPREGEGEGGGGRGGTGVATRGGRVGRGGAGGNGHAKGANHQQQPHEPTKAQTAHARAVSRKEEAANAAAKAKGHQEFLASHAAAVAKREGTAGAGQRKARTDAEREHTLAKLQQRSAQRELEAAQTAHEAAKAHLSDASTAVNHAHQQAHEELRQAAISKMLARSPEKAAKYTAAKAEAQRLRAIADAHGKAWEAHYEQHGESPGEAATNDMMRHETAAQRAEMRVREMENKATQSITGEHITAHPSVVAARAERAQAAEALSHAESRLQDAKDKIEPWRVAEAAARVDKERGGSGFAIRDDGGKAQEHLQTLFGHKLTNEEIGSLVGALPGDHIHLEARDTYKGEPVVEIRLHGAGFDPHAEAQMNGEQNGAYWASRHIERDENGKLVMHNDGNRQYESGQGTGARIFGRQVQALSKLGVDRIETNAAGSKHDNDYNGYYTWARFGYNARFDPSEHGFSRSDLPASIRSAKTLHGVMRTQEGRDWWRENGGGFGGVFNLHPGSVSLRVWNKYKRGRGLKLSELLRGGLRFAFARDIDWADEDEAASDRAWDELDAELRKEEAAGGKPMRDEALEATRVSQRTRANLSERRLTFSGGGYNPYRDAHGRFAPGPHAPHEDENGGGGGGGGSGHAAGHASGHAGGGGGGSGHTAHPLHQMTQAEREAHAQGELDAAHQRYQNALAAHRQAGQELRAARIHETTMSAAYADAHKNAEAELRHQAMRDARVREPERYAQYERLARAAQAHLDRFNDLSRQEGVALQHVADVRTALRARGLSGAEVDRHPDYVQASRDFHAIRNEGKLQGHLYTQSTRAANRAADRLVGNRVSEDAIHAHPLVAPAHAALTAASQRANELEAARATHEREAIAADAAVQRAEGMLDVARGGSGVAVKYWPSRAGVSAQDAIHQTFGRDLSEHELAKLSGASVGDKLDVQPSVGAQGGISVSLRGPEIERRFAVVRDAQTGDIILHDEYTANKGERTAGSGRDLIRGMDNMREVGVTRLYATAARGPALNGYYTWAKMGFVGDVPHGLKGAVQSRFGPGVRRVEQVMDSPGGAAWWKQFGTTWDAEFDFHPGSQSMRTFARWRTFIDRHEGTAQAGGQ